MINKFACRRALCSTKILIRCGGLTFFLDLSKLNLAQNRGEKMPDTMRGYRPNERCSDCGEMGTTFKHWGDLLPKGLGGDITRAVYFCTFCWNQRLERQEKGEPQLPLGVKPPGVLEGFANESIEVRTSSGSIYAFGKPDEKGERTVSRISTTGAIDFTRCKIICAVSEKRLWLRPLDSKDPDLHMWVDAPVISIE